MQHEVTDRNAGTETTSHFAAYSPTCHRRVSSPLLCLAGKFRDFGTHSTRGVVQVLMGTSSQPPEPLTQGPSKVLGQVKKDSAAVLVVGTEVRRDGRNHRMFRRGAT